jgi:RNA-directed DNA polymerase
MAWSAKEEGESESRPVIGRIGIAEQSNIIPRESGQTSLWSFDARALEEATKEVKQMTTETAEVSPSDPSVGATADNPRTWHQINWRQAERNVRRLQARIAQATQAGKWNKVKALQRLLTHSFSGKAEAPQTSDGKHW